MIQFLVCTYGGGGADISNGSFLCQMSINSKILFWNYSLWTAVDCLHIHIYVKYLLHLYIVNFVCWICGINYIIKACLVHLLSLFVWTALDYFCRGEILLCSAIQRKGLVSGDAACKRITETPSLKSWLDLLSEHNFNEKMLVRINTRNWK